jgi:hypothetical protein
VEARISDAIFARFRADAQRASDAAAADPGGQLGNDSHASAAGSHPNQLFGQATPEPEPTLTEWEPTEPEPQRPVKNVRKAF